METWISHNSPGKQGTAAAGCTAVGLIMALSLDHHFTGHLSDGNAGFLLGLLLLAIGVAGMVFTGRQTVVIDPRERAIRVEDRTLLGSKCRTIPFREVAAIHIGFLGKRSNLSVTYYLELQLQSGERYSLFAPGRFYEGASERSVVEGWRSRLERYIVQAS
jgi:hypothetical protein